MADFCTVLPSIVNCSTYWPAVIILVIICFGYNALIDWLYSEGMTDLTVWLQVAGDLLVTIFFGIVYGFEAAAVLLSLFAFSGLVMIIGAVRRNKRRREDDRIETIEATRLTMGNGGKNEQA